MSVDNVDKVETTIPALTKGRSINFQQYSVSQLPIWPSYYPFWGTHTHTHAQTHTHTHTHTHTQCLMTYLVDQKRCFKVLSNQSLSRKLRFLCFGMNIPLFRCLASNGDSDETVWMHRLVWVFAACHYHTYSKTCLKQPLQNRQN